MATRWKPRHRSEPFQHAPCGAPHSRSHHRHTCLRSEATVLTTSLNIKTCIKYGTRSNPRPEDNANRWYSLAIFLAAAIPVTCCSMCSLTQSTLPCGDIRAKMRVCSRYLKGKHAKIYFPTTGHETIGSTHAMLCDIKTPRDSF